MKSKLSFNTIFQTRWLKVVEDHTILSYVTDA